jgi:hypothetical protein
MKAANRPEGGYTYNLPSGVRLLSAAWRGTADGSRMEARKGKAVIRTLLAIGGNIIETGERVSPGGRK